MATSVTEAQVRKVILIENDPVGLDIPFHIETADLIATGRLSDCGYSTELTDRIIVNLAAHFTSLFLREPEEQELGDSREKYTRELASSMLSTRFGQSALALDYKGVLKNDNNTKYIGSLGVIC